MTRLKNHVSLPANTNAMTIFVAFALLIALGVVILMEGSNKCTIRKFSRSKRRAKSSGTRRGIAG